MNRKSLLSLMLLCFALFGVARADEVTIGSLDGATNNSYLPMNSLYNYSYTQQIYTAEEIGMAGTINSITVWMYGNANLYEMPFDIYMLEVDKDAYESNTDWVPVTTADIVYSGTVTVHNTDAEPFTFDLSTPFDYSGNGNLLIAFNNTTGSWKSGLNGKVFGANGDAIRAIYARQDSGAYDPTNPTFSAYGTTYQRDVILFDITPAGGVVCDKPETIEATNVTAYEADVTWEGGSGIYNLQWKKNSEEWSDDNIISNLTVTSYSFTELDGNTTYNVRVQSVCSDRSLSGWKSVNFTTANPCAAPTNLVISNITPSSATLSWTAGYQETTWTVKYKKSSETEYVTETVNAPTITLTGLDGLTTYNVQVYNCTEEGSPYLSGSFTTAASIPLVEEFSTTSLPTGWAKYSGLLSDAMNGTAPTTTSSGWFFGNYNGVFDTHTRVNIYSTGCKYWLAMPAVVMENNVQLSFEVAYTAYSGTGVAPDQSGVDDKFAVVVYANDALTILRQWDNAGSEYVLNDLTPTPIAVNFDLSSFAGQSVIVAFYAESTVANTDNNLHIDNVSIDYIPDCPKPTVLTVADVTAHTAQLGWTSDAAAWQICLNEDEDNLIDVTTNPYTLENLAEETAYTVKVRANCGNDGYSEWSNEVSFTTPIACPAPTGLAISDITGHEATLNWTGSSDSYIVSYRRAAYAEGIYEQFNKSGVPSGWTKYQGLVDGVLDGTVTLTTGGNWTTTNLALGQYNMKLNIYGTTCKSWLVTPEFTLGQNLSFDLALTDYNNADPIENDTLQPDDRFIVLIYANDAWTILREWNNTGSQYVFNAIATTGENVTIDLSAYMGQNVKIAFYGESTVGSNGDNDLHIDNVFCGVPYPAGEWMTATTDTTTYTLTGLDPESEYEVKVASSCPNEISHETAIVSFTTDVACPAPTGLAVANIGPNSADLSWTSGADAWQIEVTDNQDPPVITIWDATTNPFTLPGLFPETQYTIRVRANCGDEGYSEWSSDVRFTTLEACPVPANVTVSDITYNSATVAWTGFNDSYVISYRTAAGEDAPFKQNFENELGEWTFTSMNAANDIDGTGTNPAGIYPVAAHSGSFGFRFSSFSQKTSDETFDQYLVSPELTVTGNLKFYFKKYNTSTETLYFGYSTTTNDLDAFTWSEDLAPTQQWQEYTQELASDVKYIAFHYFGNYTYYVYVDDITIGAYDVPAGEWETVEATESPVILTGLTPETTYEVKMQGFCAGEPTEETAIVTFTTPEQTTVDQVVSMSAGWTYWSANVEVTLDDLKAALVEALPGTVIVINSQSGQSTTYNGVKWRGSLTTLDLTQMYMIKVLADCEIVLTGMPIDPAALPITINTGTNWIAFPLGANMTVNDAFAGFAVPQDMVSSSAGSTTYNGTRWRGNISTLEPNQGYIYKSAAAEPRTLVYPTSAK